jgi:hypothetical protein
MFTSHPQIDTAAGASRAEGAALNAARRTVAAANGDADSLAGGNNV